MSTWATPPAAPAKRSFNVLTMPWPAAVSTSSAAAIFTFIGEGKKFNSQTYRLAGSDLVFMLAFENIPSLSAYALAEMNFPAVFRRKFIATNYGAIPTKIWRGRPNERLSCAKKNKGTAG